MTKEQKPSPSSEEVGDGALQRTQDGAAERDDGLSRRTFLKYAGVSFSAVAISDALTSCAPGTEPHDQSEGALAASCQPEFMVSATRKEDLLALVFGFANMRPSADGRQLVRQVAGRPAYILAYHAPQHILERGYNEEESSSFPPFPQDPPPSPPTPVSAKIAGMSRIVFKVPDDLDAIPYALSSLLTACIDYQMSLPVNAIPPDPVVVPNPFPIPASIFGGPGGSGATGAINVAPVGAQGPSPDAATPAIQFVRDAKALLDASRGSGVELIRAPVMDPGPSVTPGRPVMPGGCETALELPFRLTVAPNSVGQWVHALQPVVAPSTGRFELWHSRLAVRGLNGRPYEGQSRNRTVRALWTRDTLFRADNPRSYVGGSNYDQFQDPFLYAAHPDFPTASLTPKDRIRIVHQSSNFTDLISVDPATGMRVRYRPHAIDVNRLMLTTLGSWVDLRGDFGECPPLNLAVWEHRATMARDHYVKIVETGYLYPFGHPAVRIRIAERKFKYQSGIMEPAGNYHPHRAFIRIRTFIMVKKPVLTYESGFSLSETGKTLRTLPFKTITIKTLTTPTLDPGAPGFGSTVTPVFEPHVGGRPFRFNVEAIDREGNVSQFSTPAVWVEGNCGNVQLQDLDCAQVMFNTTTPENVRQCDFNGQRVAFAKESKPGDTTYEAKTVAFKGRNFLVTGMAGGCPAETDRIPTAERRPSGYEAPFLPYVDKAWLAVEAIRHLAGQQAMPAFQYHDAFRNNGFGEAGGGNAGEVLLKLATGTLGLNFNANGTDKSGGFISPNLDITGLTRKSGPVGGNLSLPTFPNSFDPAGFFNVADALNQAKLFGVFGLGDVLQSGLGLDLQAPKFVTQALDTVEGFIHDALALKAAIQPAWAASQAAINDLLTAIDNVKGDIDTAINNVKTGVTPPIPSAFGSHITAIGSAFDGFPAALDLLSGAGAPTKGVSFELKRRAKQLKAVLTEVGDWSTLLTQFINLASTAKDLRVKLEWRPTLRAFPTSESIFVPNDPSNSLILSVEARAKKSAGKPPGLDILASLENFRLNLIGSSARFIVLHFHHVRFELGSGKKPDIDVKLGNTAYPDGIEFAGPLSFVNELKKIIPLDGFSDPPAISVSPSGIEASFSLGLPSLAVGIFSLQNISLGAGFRVPFIGDPLTVSFNFCTQEHPFILTVSMLGGGGFFKMTLSPKGMYRLEAQLQFGAALSLDFGVASGMVSIMAGIHFLMQAQSSGPDAVTLTGFLSIHGEVDVLGLISASITLRMELRYESSSGKVVGKASLEIEVKVFLFSATVTVSCERKFAGSNADPSLADTMSEDDFGQYLAAFAA